MLREELERSKVKPESGIDRLIKEIEKLKIFKKQLTFSSPLNII